MAYRRKTRDRWDIETNYGYGWECEDSCYDVASAKYSLKGYQELMRTYGGMVRMVKRRERLTEE